MRIRIVIHSRVNDGFQVSSENGKGATIASLFVISGRSQVDYYPLGKRTNVIGRDESVPIQVVDRRVSRKHLQILFDKETEFHYAIDMSGRNGVFINGERIENETVLADGDQIQCSG